MTGHQKRRLAFRNGEIDLMVVRDKWNLACVCDIDDPALIKTTDVLGVDFGIVNIATDGDGKSYTGAHLVRRRAGLQRRASKAAKRRLRKLTARQRKFQTHCNRVISKAFVGIAQRSGRAIGLEDPYPHPA